MSNQSDINRKDDEITASNEISKSLKENNIKFKSEVLVGTTSTDFFVEVPSGGTVIFDIKQWEPTPENIERAKNFAILNTSASGVDNAYIVLPHLQNSYMEFGVISPFEVVNAINLIKENETKQTKPKIRRIPKKKIFAAMPFSAEYDDTYTVAMRPATLKFKCDCVRVDHEEFNEDIVAKIKKLISESIAVIADLSESRPNVFYETGFAEGLELPIIQICSTPYDDIPFDVRNNNTIQYNRGQTSILRNKLIKRLQSIPAIVNRDP